jgi:AraC-like DNA-binding protein
VESANGKIRIHSHLAAGDTRGAAFHRLHDAVQSGADRLALEVAVAEAISAFAAVRGAKCEHTRAVRGRFAAGVRPSEIALRVGLYDQSQLNRHFPRMVRTTPGAYARGNDFTEAD